MTEIRDLRGRIICMADQETGQLRCLYRDYGINTYIDPGHSILIQRDECVTIITRNEKGFSVRCMNLD